MSTTHWPHGMDEVKAFYGDPGPYLIHDGQGISEDWTRDILALWLPSWTSSMTLACGRCSPRTEGVSAGAASGGG
jgi:hypothetical protein